MFKFRLPMRLQYFAEPKGGGAGNDPDNQEPTNTDPKGGNDPDNPDDLNKDDPTDEIVEKLRHRIGQEQAHKNELKVQLEKATAELEKLRKGEKPGTEKPLTPEQKRIQELEGQIERDKILKDTSNVFKEAGVSVPDNIIDVFVSNDRDKTIDNARLLMDWAGSIRKSTEDSMREKYQKGYIPKDTKHGNSSTNFGEQMGKDTEERPSLDAFK